MMNRRVELRPTGMYVVHDRGEHPLEFVVGHRWYVQFREEQGPDRYGFVVMVDREQRHLEVMDAIAYPNAPSPWGAKLQIIPFEAVEIAGNGFDSLGTDVVVDGSGKRVGKREIRTIVKRSEREATLGWIARRGGGRSYVDLRGERWQIRGA